MADRGDAPYKLTELRTYVEIVRRVYNGATQHRVNGLAAEVAFFSLFALPPSLLALFSAIGFVSDYVGPEATNRVRNELLANAERFLTADTVKTILAPTVDELLKGGRVDLFSLGIVLAILSASAAADALLAALHIAYAIDQRLSMWKRRGLAILYTLVAVIWGALLLPLLVMGPDFGHAITRPLGLESTVDFVWGVLYWPVLLSFALVTLTAVYHFALPWRTPFLRDLPGTILAMLLWIVGTWALRAYGKWVVGSSPIYGSLASPMIVLAWLFFTAFGVLMGAELNAAIESLWPTVTRKEKKEVLKAAVEELRAKGDDVAPVSVTGPQAARVTEPERRRG
jgi:membrane protein